MRILNKRSNLMKTNNNNEYFQMKGLKNRRCAMCRAEFSSEFLEHPQLLFSSMPSTSNWEQNEYQWFYKGHNGIKNLNLLL